MRPIVRPEPGTVLVAINGVTVANWTVDCTTGLVTFTPPYSQTFDDTLTKERFGDANYATLTGNAGDFNAFVPYIHTNNPGVQCKITMTGWSNAGNNIAVSQTAIIVIAVNNGGAALIVQYPAHYGIQADSAVGVTIAVHPAPANGLQITAGLPVLCSLPFRHRHPAGDPRRLRHRLLEQHQADRGQAVRVLRSP